MDSVINALLDLTKFKIIASINTGDKTFDNLINTFLISLLIAVAAYFKSNNLIMYLKIKYDKRYQTITPESIPYYTDYAYKNIDKYKCVIMPEAPFSVSKDKLDKLPFMTLFTGYVLKIHATAKTESLMINYENNIVLDQYDLVENTKGSFYTSMTNYKLKDILTVDKCYPLYVKNNEVIFVKKGERYLKLYYYSSSILQEFLNYIRLLPIAANEIVEESKDIKIYHHSTPNNPRNLYTDRTFAGWISHHKPRVMKLLDIFEKNNNCNNLHYKNYNLGIMLQGKPGTGKTLFMKAMANHFKRSIYIVDMKNIKTKKDFTDLFVKYTSFIYVFDEFDCVQGIIRSRALTDDKTINTKEQVQSKKITQLKDRMLTILALLSKSVIDSKSEDNPLTKELNDIKQEISDLENALTLETMLTCLDGIDEMRGRIIIAATNHIKFIDNALLRPGRFDYQLELSEYTPAETKELIIQIFQENRGEKLTPYEYELIDKAELVDGKYTPAYLVNAINSCETVEQVLILLNKNNTIEEKEENVFEIDIAKVVAEQAIIDQQIKQVNVVEPTVVVEPSTVKTETKKMTARDKLKSHSLEIGELDSLFDE